MIKFEIDGDIVKVSEIDGTEKELSVELVLMAMVLMKQIGVTKEGFDALKDSVISCLENDVRYEDIMEEEDERETTE